MSESFKVYGYRTTQIKYSSVNTRYSSLHHFMGDAELNEENEPVSLLPGEIPENLEVKHRSGANRTDVPKMWGYPNVDRHLGNKTFKLQDDLDGWRRNAGEPVGHLK